MTLTDFDNCRTVAETNQLFKELFLTLKAQHDNSVANRLRENHRLAMTRIVYDLRATVVTVRERSDADLHLPSVRNWAVKRGLVLPKGRINKEIKAAYREAHPDVPPDAPQVPQEAAKPQSNSDDTSAPIVRAWAISQGISVGKRGRIHPDLMAQYVAAHS